MNCPICDCPGTLSCSACPEVKYCSPCHQREHWKIHKQMCSPYIVKEDPYLGKGWIASRNLKAGTILLDEFPAFHAPQWNTVNLTSNTCFCITCGSKMNNKKKKRCSRCQWPVCSRECENLKIHTENECKLFVDRRIRYNSFDPNDISWFLLMLRAMGLKKQNKALYEETINLLHIHQVAAAHVDVEQVCDEHFQKILQVLGNLEYEEEQYKRILRLTLINGFAAGDSTVTAVYPKASRINHSCSPNCTREIGPRPEFQIRIRTALNVKKGDPLTVSYFNDHTFQGTLQRQASMRSARGCGGFICRCSRCLDPSENGTMLSAITCKTCQEMKRASAEVKDGVLGPDDDKIGYFLPVDPLDIKQDAKWECNGCGSIASTSTFNPIMNKLQLMIKFGFQGLSDRMEYATLCDDIISEYSGNILHPNHWILQEAAEGIVDVMNELDSIDQHTLEKKVQLSMYMLAIRDRIAPGISTDKDLLQRHTAKDLTTLIRYFSEKMDRAKVIEHLEVCKKLQKELWTFHNNDIATNPEHNQKLLSEMHYINILSNAYASK